MWAHGFKRPGLECSHCREPFSLFLGVENFLDIDRLPDPFPAKCPACQQESTYPKSSIGILVAAGTQ